MLKAVALNNVALLITFDVDRLNADLNKALAAEMGKQLAEISLDPIGGTPQSMSDVIRTDSAMYGQIIKQAGIEPQ